METHVYETTVRKRGYLEIKNLPFEEGTVIRIAISTKGKKGNLERLINNDHVWTADDISSVQSGRDIISVWPKTRIFDQEIRNPKHEIRNNDQNRNVQMTKT